MDVDVLVCSWDGRTFTAEIKGHVTDAVKQGHDLASAIIGNRRWRITKLWYQAPTTNELASEGITTIQARTFA